MAQEINTQIRNISSAALAFLGDSVFEINIRSRIVMACEGNAEELNKRSKSLTNAKAQSRIADRIGEILSEEELAVYKRGRNLKSLTAPKSCTISEYRRATGLEALMGYLFLQGRQERIDELIDLALKTMRSEDE
ncbi:MAG: ribonuclease III [Parasporobacterium sp.]|nr:ribonuclease III [Parasporobacterium sp.]